MPIRRRAPREVYQVFSEEDFLAEGSEGELFDPPAVAPRAQPRLRRIAGLAMLVGAVAAVGGTLVMHTPRASQAPSRRSPSPAAPAPARVPSYGAPHDVIPPPAIGVTRRTRAARPGDGVHPTGPSARPASATTVEVHSAGATPVAAGPQLEFGFER